MAVSTGALPKKPLCASAHGLGGTLLPQSTGLAM
jgi:hypothetical protein